ncbi:MAG: hypothetical protein HUK19_00735, partial [Fibrobacter sp.]|nr:hypothetical protein [Fibrobacter sp.]
WRPLGAFRGGSVMAARASTEAAPRLLNWRPLGAFRGGSVMAARASTAAATLAFC